jgi:hypothetical protein
VIKKFLNVCGILFFSIVLISIAKADTTSVGEDVPLSYTHIAPSPAVIPGGSFVLGTSVGYGFFDLFDVSSNLVSDLEGVFNIGAKIAVYHNHNFAFAPYVYFSTQSLIETDQSGNQATLTSTAWAPGAVFSYRVASKLTGDTAFTYVSRNPPIPKNTVQNPRTAYVQGNTGNQEFTLGITGSLALSMGASYDFTYDIFGAGASVHVAGFQVGGQYYFNVSQGNFMPILSVGFAASF